MENATSEDAAGDFSPLRPMLVRVAYRGRLDLAIAAHRGATLVLLGSSLNVTEA